MIISQLGLSNNVTLEGLGNAAKVVGRGWIFLNSSKTEGLPLALGEAGLAGLPIVCTDVGGSREIIADGPVSFGAMAPPGKPEALGRAQLKVLAMLDGLEEMVTDVEGWRARQGKIERANLPKLADYVGPTAADDLLRRIYDASPLRQQLGMLYVHGCVCMAVCGWLFLWLW